MNTLIAANWKMHGDLSWVAKMAELNIHFAERNKNIEVLICPPAYMIPSFVIACKNLDISIGAQNCHFETNGAFTGEMSADMVSDAGADYVIVGHSERRAIFGETDEVVAQKSEAASNASLTPIVCVGENREQREAGDADEVVGVQLQGSIPASSDGKNIAIAYEPVWAIGTGLVPTLEDIAAMHDHIRGILTKRFGEKTAEKTRILYGGSVKPSNAKDILALGDVNGALIGGASLEMESLAAIAKCVEG